MVINRIHARLPWQVKPPEAFRNRANDKVQLAFHNSQGWRKVSALYRSAHPLCEACQAGGRVTPAELTDHVIPIEAGGDHWDERNLMSLCHPHHNRKSGMESRVKRLGDVVKCESGRLIPKDKMKIISQITRTE